MSITEDVCGDHPFIVDVSSDYFAIWCNLIIGVFLKNSFLTCGARVNKHCHSCYDKCGNIGGYKMQSLI